MSQQLTSAIEIAARPARVFASLADFRNHVLWEGVVHGKGLVDLEMTTSGPVSVGTRFQSTGKDGSFVMRDESIVTEFEPGRVIRYTTVSKAVGAVMRWRHGYVVEAVGDTTRVTYTIEGRPANLVGWLFWPMVLMSRSSGSRLIATTLERFKEHCETQTAISTAEAVPAVSATV